MSPLDIVLIVLMSISMVISAISIILVFAWRHTTPEISDIRTNMNALAMDQANIIEKFTHYMNREDARNARNAKKHKKNGYDDEYDEAVKAPPPPPLTLGEQKNALRRQFRR